jgi:peptidoglycan/xylan/chitin deacetylase (PgdA/CDA1 family)
MSSIVWPAGARCAVFLSFDFDSETNWISRDPDNVHRPGTLSQGTYGAKVGVPKLLELLRDEELRATFFVPGWVAEHRTERVEQILAGGHEVGHHGYLHKWPDPAKPEEELDELQRGLEALQNRLGVRPAGYRSPAGETSLRTLNLLADNGFLYDSSLMDDVVPYDHVLPDGRMGPVELPWHWSLDDAPFMLSSIKAHRPIFTNDHILDIWQAEFRAIHEWGGLFTLVMHPQAIGRPSRLELLKRFIAYTRGFSGVWYATGREISHAWRKQREGQLVAPQPISPFITVPPELLR